MWRSFPNTKHSSSQSRTEIGSTEGEGEKKKAGESQLFVVIAISDFQKIVLVEGNGNSVFSHTFKSQDRLNLGSPELSYLNKNQMIDFKIASLLIKSV